MNRFKSINSRFSAHVEAMLSDSEAASLLERNGWNDAAEVRERTNGVVFVFGDCEGGAAVGVDNSGQNVTVVEFRSLREGKGIEVKSGDALDWMVLGESGDLPMMRTTTVGNHKWVCVAECMKEMDCMSLDPICRAAWYAGCISGCA